MKNKLYVPTLLTALLALTAATAQAQGLILRGGMNMSNASTDPEFDDDAVEPRYGFSGHILADAPLSDAIHLMFGPGYVQRGLNFTSSTDDKYPLTADYLTMPIMLSLRAPTEGPKLFVNLGVEPAYLLSSDFDAGGFNVDLEDDVEKFDFALRGEVGMEFPLGYDGPSAILGLGYSYSLTDAAPSDDFTWNHYAFHAFLGVRLGR